MARGVPVDGSGAMGVRGLVTDPLPSLWTHHSANFQAKGLVADLTIALCIDSSAIGRCGWLRWWKEVDLWEEAYPRDCRPIVFHNPLELRGTTRLQVLHDKFDMVALMLASATGVGEGFLV
jgi:hypothetical protein